MKSSEEFKWNLIATFIIFSTSLIISITYIFNFNLSALLNHEFKMGVKREGERILKQLHRRMEELERAGVALSQTPLLGGSLKVEPEIVEEIFKISLASNSSIIFISYLNNRGEEVVRCWKRFSIWCQQGGRENGKPQNRIEKKIVVSNGTIGAVYSIPLAHNRGVISLKGVFKELLEEAQSQYYTILINGRGKILFSNFIRAPSIQDFLNYQLVERILKKGKEGFITDDIYLIPLGKYKLLLLQRKELLEQSDLAAKKFAFFALLIATLVSIPLGIFFSRPILEFYRELDQRVQEEVEKRREKEQLLLHQSKLAALGEMLGNIAHQWRHPLTRLSLLIQNLDLAHQLGKLTPERFKEFREQAQLQIEYMSDTIDDFINFFRKDGEKKRFYPSQIVKDSLKLMEGRLKQKGVKVSIQVEGEEEIEGYRSEFSQVILNIINNAVDILTERRVPNPQIWVRIVGKRIEIEDNGGGVPEEIGNKIFEPYFTTKFQSQGTGIGLYMSRVIITQHFGGKLYYYNSNDGAVFVIELP